MFMDLCGGVESVSLLYCRAVCVVDVCVWVLFFVFKQKTAYEMRISDWSSDVCSSDLMAKDIGATVFATAGDDEKLVKATALGADHVVNYRTDRFEGVVRRLTAKRGVDVVFEHVGPATWAGSMFSLTNGDRKSVV